MILEMRITNYRSVGDAILKPGNLSILIGPNGSGKSNILDVLSFVRDAVTLGLPAAITSRGGIDSVRRRSGGHPFNLRLELKIKLKDSNAIYVFEITGDRLEEYKVKTEYARIYKNGNTIAEFDRRDKTWRDSSSHVPRIDEQSLALTALGGAKDYKPLVDYLSSIEIYSIFPDTLKKAQKFDAAKHMKRHGENWVSILRTLIKSKNAKENLIKGLKKLTGDIEDVRVTSAAGYLVAEFKQQVKAKKGKRWFAADQQSDGTLRVAGLITALLQEPNLPVIGIEEPELTVHPGALPMIYDYIKEASEYSQIILTTHSPIMLDVIDINQDTIYVVNRKKGITHVKKVDEDLLKPIKESLLSLGEMFISGDLQISLFEDSDR